MAWIRRPFGDLLGAGIALDVMVKELCDSIEAGVAGPEGGIMPGRVRERVQTNRF